MAFLSRIKTTRIASKIASRSNGMAFVSQFLARSPLIVQRNVRGSYSSPHSVSIRNFSNINQNAVEDLQTWSKLNQDGMNYLREGNPTDLIEAERCFRKATNLMSSYHTMPYKSLSLANLASTLVRKGSFNDAINIFRPLLLELPMFTQVSAAQIATIHMELANCYELIGEPNSAIRELNLASSRFANGAAHYVKQINSVDALPDHEKTENLNQQRTQLIMNAINAWKSALGCRFSSAVLFHKVGDWEDSRVQLNKLLDVYRDMFNCIDIICEQIESNENIDRKQIPQVFPKASRPGISGELSNLLATMDLTYLKDLHKQSCSDIANVLQSIAAVNLDLQDIEIACDAYEDAAKLTLKGNIDDFMPIIADASKSCRLLYEKLQYEMNTTDFDEEGNRLRNNDDGTYDSSDPSAIVFRNADLKSIEKAMAAIDRSRVRMRAIFTEYAHEMKRLSDVRMEELKNKTDFSDYPPEFVQMMEEIFPTVLASVQKDIDSGALNLETGELDPVRAAEVKEEARLFRLEHGIKGHPDDEPKE